MRSIHLLHSSPAATARYFIEKTGWLAIYHDAEERGIADIVYGKRLSGHKDVDGVFSGNVARKMDGCDLRPTGSGMESHHEIRDVRNTANGAAGEEVKLHAVYSVPLLVIENS